MEVEFDSMCVELDYGSNVEGRNEEKLTENIFIFWCFFVRRK